MSSLPSPLPPTTVNNQPNTNNNGGGIDIYSILSKSNVILLIWFLAIYIVISFVLKTAFSPTDQNYDVGLMTSRTFDFIVLFFIVILFVANPKWLSLDYEIQMNEQFALGFKSFVDNKTSTFSTLFFLFVFYTLVYIFGIPMGSHNKSFFILKIEIVAWFVLLVCVLNLFFMSFMQFSLIDLIFEWISEIWNGIPYKNNKIYDVISSNTKISGNANVSPSSNVTVCGNSICENGQVCGTENVCVNGPLENPPSLGQTPDVFNSSGQTPEVFNISNNIYTYEEAQAVCSAVGSKVATYDQVEEVYKDGGEWCSYGWTDGQMALYPTQKETWKKLQNNEKTKNSCGRPGINGGYIQNPYMKFGVNCYGIKPSPKQSDIDKISYNQEIISPKTPEELALENKIQNWKNNADRMLNINPFNGNKWNES